MQYTIYPLSNLIYRFYPVILFLALMSLHFISAYPGGMTYDTLSQYTQSITGHYLTQHPPLMAMLWSLFHYIYQGPQTMLLFHLSLLWSGMLLLYYSDAENKYKFLYFLLPFFPQILSQSGMIWKDVSFAFGSFFIIATCIFYTYKKKTAPLYIIIGLLLLCFYIVNVKFQAKFIIPILIFFILTLYLRNNLTFRVIICTILSLIIISSNMIFNNYLATNSNWHQNRQLFDLAGISVRTNSDTMLPSFVKSSPLYNFEN